MKMERRGRPKKGTEPSSLVNAYIRMDPGLYARIKSEACAMGISMAAWVCLTLERSLLEGESAGSKERQS